jgi:hypothetical protein
MRTISCTLFVILLSLLAVAQPKAVDTSYHLLWFKGKKIRENVLLTPYGDTITYSPSRSNIKITSKGGSGKLMDNMLAELNKTPQRINKTITQLATVMPKAVLPYFAEPVNKAFTSVYNDLSGAVSNIYTIPELIPGARPARKAGPFYTYEEYFDELDAPIADVLAYYEKIKNEKINWVPAPPRKDYSYCNSCDSAAGRTYDRDFEIFEEELMGKDDDYFRKVLTIMRHAQLVMSEERMDEVNNLMRPVFDFLINRQVEKVRLLAAKYINDPSRVHAIIKVGLPVERHRQLLGMVEKNDDFLDSFFSAGLLSLAKMLEKAKNEYDYPIALNVELILTLERHYQLMGTTGEKPWQLDEMLNFNQFKMNVKASAKMSGNGGYLLAELKGDNYFSAIPGKDCRLQWILMGPDHQKAKYDLMAAEVRGPGGELTYVGSKNWASDAPRLRLDFCNEAEEDSIEMFLFHEASHKELWVVPGMGTMQLSEVAAVMMGCFIDEERVRQIKDRFSDPKEVQKLMKGINDKAASFMSNNKGGLNGKSPAQMSAQEIQQLSLAMNDTKAIMDKIHESAFTYLFKLEPNNRNSLLLRESINGKELFPRNAATEYAWLHIRLEQDPKSPYNLMSRMTAIR